MVTIRNLLKKLRLLICYSFRPRIIYISSMTFEKFRASVICLIYFIAYFNFPVFNISDVRTRQNFFSTGVFLIV
jgi:hypothetical protein